MRPEAKGDGEGLSSQVVAFVVVAAAVAAAATATAAAVGRAQQCSAA